MPWLARYVSHFPMLIRTFTDLRTVAFGRAKVRYESGSKTKDLFYYLVRRTLLRGRNDITYTLARRAMTTMQNQKRPL